MTMQQKKLKYIRLQSDDDLPTINELRPFKAILIVEEEVSQLWQWEVSRWIALSGCHFTMAWGKECASWAEAVEEASLEAFNYEDIPEDQQVITTSHEDEELPEVFWFSKHRASHPVHDLKNTVIVHIAAESRQADIEDQYEEA